MAYVRRPRRPPEAESSTGPALGVTAALLPGDGSRPGSPMAPRRARPCPAVISGMRINQRRTVHNVTWCAAGISGCAGPLPGSGIGAGRYRVS